MAGRLALDGRLVIFGICRCASLACALQSRWQAARLQNHVVNRRCVFRHQPTAVSPRNGFGCSTKLWCALPILPGPRRARRLCPTPGREVDGQHRWQTDYKNASYVNCFSCNVMEIRVGQQPAAVDGHDHGKARLLYDAEVAAVVGLVDCR